MKCPVCSKDMVEQDFGSAKVDVCVDGCKGIWFDWLELTKLDEGNEGAGKALQEALKAPRNNGEGRDQINCPKCAIPMQIHSYKLAKEINVDECYKCAGFYLDAGELKEIRANAMTDEELEAYTKKLLSEIPEYAQASDDLDKKKLRADAVKSYTKFLRASYYIKGE